jgi:hypothetical protein
MLIKIAKVIGGNAKIINNNEKVIWIVDKKKSIIDIIKIFSLYPPLTSRLNCQLEFLKSCLNNPIHFYLNERNNKYNMQSSIINKFNNNFNIPHYYPSWLSGFLETKGYFLIKNKEISYFYIGLNNDFYLLNSIKNFFHLTVSIKYSSKTFYSIEIFKKETLNNIVNHCISNPLLGEKSKSFSKFIKIFYK